MKSSIKSRASGLITFLIITGLFQTSCRKIPVSSDSSSKHDSSDHNSSDAPPFSKQISQLMAVAVDYSHPLNERINALNKLNTEDSDESNRALVELIAVEITKPGGKSLMSSDSDVCPALSLIRKKGVKATPHLLARICDLVAKGAEPTTELRLLCMTVRSSCPSETIDKQLDDQSRSKYPKDIIDRTKALIASFAR